MKKYLFGSFAIATAIIAFAFTTPNKSTVVNCQPNTQYVWFYIASGAVLPCETPDEPINPTAISFQGHYASSPGSTNPLSDLNAFRLTQTNFLLQDQVCDEVLDILCAVAYNLADVTVANFDKVPDPSSPSGFSWRPKASGPVPACYICKTEQ